MSGESIKLPFHNMKIEIVSYQIDKDLIYLPLHYDLSFYGWFLSKNLETELSGLEKSINQIIIYVSYNKVWESEIVLRKYKTDITAYLNYPDLFNHSLASIDIVQTLLGLNKVFLEVLNVLKSRKYGSMLDVETISNKLIQAKLEFENSDLQVLRNKFIHEVNQQEVEAIHDQREKRKNTRAKKYRKIRDLRIYFDYEVSKKYADLAARISNSLFRKLHRLELECPDYHHVYIKIADNEKDKLLGSLSAEEWFVYGCVILPKDLLENANEKEAEKLLIQACNDGLLDLSEIDGLSKETISIGIEHIKEFGVFSEKLIASKSNRNYGFMLSERLLKLGGKTRVSIYLQDKQTNLIFTKKLGDYSYGSIADIFSSIKIDSKEIVLNVHHTFHPVLDDFPKKITIVINDLLKTNDLVQTNHLETLKRSSK